MQKCKLWLFSHNPNKKDGDIIKELIETKKLKWKISKLIKDIKVGECVLLYISGKVQCVEFILKVVKKEDDYILLELIKEFSENIKNLLKKDILLKYDYISKKRYFCVSNNEDFLNYIKKILVSDEDINSLIKNYECLYSEIIKLNAICNSNIDTLNIINFNSPMNIGKDTIIFLKKILFKYLHQLLPCSFYRKICSIPIFLINEETMKKYDTHDEELDKFYEELDYKDENISLKTEYLGVYIRNDSFNKEGIIFICPERIKKIVHTEKEFNYLVIKVIIHEIAHYIMDIDFDNSTYIKHDIFYKFMEESLANKFVLELLNNALDIDKVNELFDFSKNFIKKQPPNYALGLKLFELNVGNMLLWKENKKKLYLNAKIKNDYLDYIRLNYFSFNKKKLQSIFDEMFGFKKYKVRQINNKFAIFEGDKIVSPYFDFIYTIKENFFIAELNCKKAIFQVGEFEPIKQKWFDEIIAPNKFFSNIEVIMRGNKKIIPNVLDEDCFKFNKDLLNCCDGYLLYKSNYDSIDAILFSDIVGLMYYFKQIDIEEIENAIFANQFPLYKKAKKYLLEWGIEVCDDIIDDIFCI